MKIQLRKIVFSMLAMLGLLSSIIGQIQISGRITESSGNPLEAVSINIVDTDNGSFSDSDGRFTITASEGQTLRISYVGYKTIDRAVSSNETNYDIVMESDQELLDEVIVTGVFDKRSRLQSSVAITTINAKQLERIVPNSGIDMLKNIPGVYVNTARGEISGSLNTRGLTVGGGFFYVSMQEDGLPIMAAQGNSLTNANYKPDGFLRADANIQRIEAVRGGSASILGANAPGGIFNYVSKTGGDKFEGLVRTRVGLEGDGKNPYYRLEANIGGPLSKDKSLTYNIGGHYRHADGAKYPGYALSRGGQLKANIVKKYGSGSLKLYAKILNDRTAQFEFTPTVGFNNPKPAGNFTNTSSTVVAPIKLTVPGSTWNRTSDFQYNSEDVALFKDYSVGLNWEQKIGDGWVINNNARIGQKNNPTNLTAVVFPFRVDQPTFYGVGGNIPRFGTYEFFNIATGASYGKAQQLPPAGAGQPLRFINNGLSLPGGEVMQIKSLLEELMEIQLRFLIIEIGVLIIHFFLVKTSRRYHTLLD
jgi:iron complex outermembrane recepter protein